MRLRSFCAKAAYAGRTIVATASHEERRQARSHLFGKDRQQYAQETVDAHLRHCAGEQHRRAGGRFGVGRRQPGVEWDNGYLDREAENAPAEEKHRAGREPCQA